MESDKSFISKFIETYKYYSALWNTKSDIYKNKYQRSKGIEALIKLCKEKFQEADESFVKRKINNLRTAFKRELNKVQQAKRTRSSSDDIYIPTLKL